VDVPEREIEVYRFQETWREGERRGFVVECSSGTYVRSLITGLGDAYCVELRRTAIGAFDVHDADPDRMVPLDEALSFLGELRLDPERARRVEHGARVPGDDAPPGVLRLTDDSGLIALGCREADRVEIRPLVVLRPPNV
jgi:tRNA pseudouridine55 synthase